MNNDIRFMTMEEFCEAIKTSPKCWLFDAGEDNLRFWTKSENDETKYYCHDIRSDEVHVFKDMPKYQEIYHAKCVIGQPFGFYSTWKIYG